MSSHKTTSKILHLHVVIVVVIVIVIVIGNSVLVHGA